MPACIREAQSDGAPQYMVVRNEDGDHSISGTKRVLEALQTGELCPCNRNKGQIVPSSIGESIEA